MDGSEVAIIIPAYNEEATIESVITSVEPYGKPIVVNDFSSDRTESIVRQSNALLVNHEVNKGYDQALNSGMQEAAVQNFKYAITFDADGQFDPQDIARYKELLDGPNDMILGVRNQKQRLSESVFAFVTRLLYGIQDPLCGMKGYSIELYRSLGHFDSYRSVGTELALYGARKGYVFCQIPVSISSRKGPSRFGSWLRGNYTIFRALICSFTRRHPK